MSPVQSDSKLSALGLKILAILDDGEWHDQEEVIEKAMYMIPPGEAFRHGRAISNAIVDRRDMDDVIASGRRSKTVAMINNLVQNNRVERLGEKGRYKPKQLRITRQVARIYVVRDEHDNLFVVQQNNPAFAVHIIDAWAKSEDPAVDAERIKEIYETIPVRMPDRERVENVCRKLMNRLNVDAAVQRMMTTYQPDFEPNDSNNPDWGGTE